MDALSDLLAGFAARAGTDPVLGDARIAELIRLLPGRRAILAGHCAGQAAMFRFHLARPARAAAREWAEIARAAAFMNAAPESALRVPAPLCHVPDLGLVVVERAPGAPLMERIAAAPVAARAALVAPAVDWLRAYTAPTEAPAPVRLQGWLRRAEAGLSRLPHTPLRALKAGILVELRRLAPALSGTWRTAICHGDFHPNNLLSDGTRLTGIDTGGSARLPICRDMARFVVHLARRGIALSGETRFGVDGAGLDAFGHGFDLSGRERALILPFFVGVEALIRVETRALGSHRVRLARAVCAALRDDLRGLAP